MSPRVTDSIYLNVFYSLTNDTFREMLDPAADTKQKEGHNLCSSNQEPLDRIVNFKMKLHFDSLLVDRKPVSTSAFLRIPLRPAVNARHSCQPVPFHAMLCCSVLLFPLLLSAECGPAPWHGG